MVSGEEQAAFSGEEQAALAGAARMKEAVETLRALLLEVAAAHAPTPGRLLRFRPGEVLRPGQNESAGST